MNVFPLSILNFSRFPQDGRSILIPGKLFMANSKPQSPVAMSENGAYKSEENNSADTKSLQMDYPVQLKDMSFAFVCIDGTATIKVNLNEYTIKRGDSCVLMPESCFQIISVSSDFTCIVLAVVRDFYDYTHNVSMTMKQLSKMIDSPVTHVSDEVLDEWVEICNMMLRQLSSPNQAYREEIAKAFITLLKYLNIRSQVEEQQNLDNGHTATRRDEIFHKFIATVEKYYMKERNVMFYADKLCISPKYLSSVIHDVSGKYATEWINGYVILEAKVLLRKNDMTIKEICSTLNFANQSFFAKYFKQHTGMTPKEFRKKA